LRQGGMKRIADKQIDIGLKAGGLVGIDVDVLQSQPILARPHLIQNRAELEDVEMEVFLQ
jgi:hypothetical protein